MPEWVMEYSGEEDLEEGKRGVLELTVNAIWDLNVRGKCQSALFCHSEGDGKNARADEIPIAEVRFRVEQEKALVEWVAGLGTIVSMTRRGQEEEEQGKTGLVSVCKTRVFEIVEDIRTHADHLPLPTACLPDPAFHLHDDLFGSKETIQGLLQALWCQTWDSKNTKWSNSKTAPQMHLDLALPTRLQAAADVLQALIGSGHEAEATDIVGKCIGEGFTAYQGAGKGGDRWKAKDECFDC
ncbi:hypothetical protein FIBSPDRAFT_961245 [Athelia psychrophila]|uniref:Uncharacterized protein n=1 Tax=Athelia psychrophila TaxID=1759441 RepID=A0A166BII2_9AGAM|nr:hypothetical protein FIBSPDRAFT_961245 [Fibularhizoctonia sp. CBS 109695]